MENQTSEIRAQKWAEIVVACNRSGQAKTAWCEEHGVNRKAFTTGKASCANTRQEGLQPQTALFRCRSQKAEKKNLNTKGSHRLQRRSSEYR